MLNIMTQPQEILPTQYLLTLTAMTLWSILFSLIAHMMDYEKMTFIISWFGIVGMLPLSFYWLVYLGSYTRIYGISWTRPIGILLLTAGVIALSNKKYRDLGLLFLFFGSTIESMNYILS